MACPVRIATQLQYYVKREKCKVNDVIFPSGCEARAINLGNKNVKIGYFTGGTSVRSKNIFTDISRYPTGKHEIISTIRSITTPTSTATTSTTTTNNNYHYYYYYHYYYIIILSVLRVFITSLFLVLKAFNLNGEQTMTTYDKDLFEILESTSNSFYVFRDIQIYHNCFGTYRSTFPKQALVFTCLLYRSF